MKRIQIGIGMIGLAALLGMGGCASQQGAMEPASEVSSVPSTTESVHQEPLDSLEACLAQIPSGSSAGARMIADQSCRDNEELRQGVVGTAIAKSGDRASAGTQGDSLEACMARIPADATAGQRMLAEQTCERDQLLNR